MQNTIQDKLPVYSFNCFTKEQVKEINKRIKNDVGELEKQDPSYTASSVSKIGEFFHVSCVPLMDLIHPWLYQCQQINRETFGYDIYWLFHLEYLNYNVYGENGEYGWHIDANPAKTLIDMKLTCLLNLSEEPYEGGEFYKINNPNKNVKFTSGMGIVFNSLIAHKVTPVTKGKRITLTYFAEGPSWK